MKFFPVGHRYETSRFERQDHEGCDGSGHILAPSQVVWFVQFQSHSRKPRISTWEEESKGWDRADKATPRSPKTVFVSATMAMNLFRLLGDLSHLASILILLHKIQTTRSCRGISFKTQALYAGVFVARYLDLVFRWVSLYNFVMKLFFIASSCYILYIMRYRFRPTHDPSIDTFRIEYLLGPCVVLALIFNYHFNLTEIMWSFSIFLESVAILPQLFMLQRTGEAETITTHYLAALGVYRALYIPNWLYRYMSENVVDPIAVTAGIVQTGLYLDFFYVYFTKVLQGQKFELPA